MSLVITDNRISKKAQSSLATHGFEVISLPSYKKLSEPVSAHPDMLLFILDDILFTDNDYYRFAKDYVDNICNKSGLKLFLCDENIKAHYPHDIPFNILKCGFYLFCKTDYTSKSIIEYAEQKNYKIVNVTQGYAKCSVCKVTDSAVITSDKNIAKTAGLYGIDVLLINEGDVTLPPYKHGFIGGASGLCEGTNSIYFCGNIDLHRDAEKIKTFCKKHNRCVVSLSDEPLFDVGTLTFVDDTII